MSLASPVPRARVNEVLTPYVPRLVVDWLRAAPDALHREVEGSMVFVDISGFTALSERLARKGKIGAELMRDSLNGVFTALLDEAYDYGAGLLKWGGDALLLLFEGPGHEARSCRAAWEMQGTLDRVGRLHVGSGSHVVLRMSVGVSTGTFQFFLVGSVHRELLVAGPAATETVTMEGIADAGEIAISPTLAARLDPRCVGPPKDITRLLSAPPEIRRARAPDVGDVRRIDIPSCIPIASRTHVLLERSEPEHRTITAAFIDLMDTDDLLERLGIDALAEALDERIRSIQEVALHYEVPFYESDVGKGSVKALLTAGAPSSTGHDEERMLRALREIMDRPGIVPMRVGVNTGKVFTGDFGPPYRRSYRVFGDAINTAARVMGKAEPGQVLATEIVIERSRTTFETTSIAPFAAKGKAEPVRASIVGAITGTREARPADTSLTGREHELQTLLSVVDDARSGRGWVVEVAGAAGIGKSRLVEELVGRSPDILVLRARCEEYESATPYFPMRAPMRTVLGLGAEADTGEVEARLRTAVENVNPALVPWLPLLGILLGLDLPDTPETRALDGRFLRERLSEVALRFLYTRLAGTPTMLAVEDVHFMDEATRDLLLRLARAGSELRQVLLVTHTDAGTAWAPMDDDDLRSLSLCLLPLPVSRAVEIVEHVTDDEPLQPHEVLAIAERSGGNPLFLFELIETVRRTGSVDALPESLESLMAGEIDRLSPEDRTVLRYASVLGSSFPPALLAEAVRQEVTLDDAIWRRLEGFLEREPSGTLRFRNALVRDSAYEGLPYRRRRELHNRVGEAIEATAGMSLEEEIGTLALHYHEAQRWEKAWLYCREAGGRAMETYANVEAARFFERALAAARRLRSVPKDDRVAAWLALASACERAGNFVRAFEALRHASLLLAGEPIEQARISEMRALARGRIGALSQAVRETTRGLKLVEGMATEPAVRARALLQAIRAEFRLQQGHAREALVLAEGAARDADATGEQEALARAYSALDGAHQMLGEPRKAVHEEKALVIWEDLGLPWRAAVVQMNMGVQAYSDGRWDDAVMRYEHARSGFRTAGDRTYEALASANLGEVLVSRGRLEEAETTLRDARRVLRASRLTMPAVFAEIQLGRLMLLRGEPAESIQALTAVVEEAREKGYPFLMLEASIHLAAAQVSGGASEAALETLAEAERFGGDEAALHAGPLRRVAAAALARLGRLDEAAEALEAALAAAHDQGLMYEELQIIQARAELAGRLGVRASEEELQEAARLLQLLGLEAV